MTDRHVDLRDADIGALQPPSTRRMLDLHDKREPGLVLRVVSRSKSDAKRAWCWRYRDTAGKQRRIVFGHWPQMTYAEAVQRLRDARRSVAEGKDPIAAQIAASRALDGRMTIGALIERYAIVRAPILKSGGETVRLLRKHVAAAIGGKAAADVKEDDFRRLLSAERERLARQDVQLRIRGFKPRTFVLLTRIHAAAGSLFSFAVEDRVVPSSPVPKLRKGSGILPIEVAKGRAFTDEEIVGFWRGLDATGMDGRTRNAMRLILLTGMRPGEVLGLQRRDIDLSATFVDRRNGTERERGNGLVTLRDTKNGLPRVVPLSSLARAVFADALKSAGAARNAFVFAAGSDDVKAMAPQTLSKAMLRRRDVFGELTPHRLRAMCAFIVERLGFGSAAASDVLGHVDGSVLRRSYSGFDGLPARADALDAVAIEIVRIAGQKKEDAHEAASAEIVPIKRKA